MLLHIGMGASVCPSDLVGQRLHSTFIHSHIKNCPVQTFPHISCEHFAFVLSCFVSLNLKEITQTENTLLLFECGKT